MVKHWGGEAADQKALVNGFLGLCSSFPSTEQGQGRHLFLPSLLGIQKNAQALHRMLKQPLVCRSSKPRLDTFQKPYIPKEKRVSTSEPLIVLLSFEVSTLGP